MCGLLAGHGTAANGILTNPRLSALQSFSEAFQIHCVVFNSIFSKFSLTEESVLVLLFHLPEVGGEDV